MLEETGRVGMNFIFLFIYFFFEVELYRNYQINLDLAL